MGIYGIFYEVMLLSPFIEVHVDYNISFYVHRMQVVYLFTVDVFFPKIAFPEHLGNKYTDWLYTDWPLTYRSACAIFITYATILRMSKVIFSGEYTIMTV